MMEVDPLRVVFLPGISWEIFFLSSSVRSTDVKKTYCLEAYSNPEGQFSLFYSSSKPSLKLLLGGLCPGALELKKTVTRKIQFLGFLATAWQIVLLRLRQSKQ